MLHVTHLSSLVQNNAESVIDNKGAASHRDLDRRHGSRNQSPVRALNHTPHPSDKKLDHSINHAHESGELEPYGRQAETPNKPTGPSHWFLPSIVRAMQHSSSLAPQAAGRYK